MYNLQESGKSRLEHISQLSGQQNSNQHERGSGQGWRMYLNRIYEKNVFHENTSPNFISLEYPEKRETRKEYL